MPKTFITERDVEDMQARGVTSIDVTDSVVLTDLAVERAMKLGVKLKRVETSSPPKASYSPSVNLIAAYPHEPNRPSMGSPLPAAPASDAELFAKIRSAVLARLDGQVNPALLDAVIAKVLAGMR
ncbi:MAG: hypothetical protein HY869_14485 [Chloroflexi bacterium]|nr:hypothetical protein [Chloroflexota bacterium]